MLKNIKVSRKIVLMIVAVALPLLAATIYASIKGFNKDINFALQEMKGNAFQTPLEALLDAIPQHHWLADAVARGDRDAKDALAAKEVEIDRAFADLELINDKYGVDLEFTKEGLAKRKRDNKDPRSVKGVWQKLKQDQAQLKSGESADRHNELVGSIRAMIAHSGDISKLILDPDLDSYYIMDVTLLALPQTQDRLATITSFGLNVLQGGTVSPKDAQQLAAYAALLKEGDVDRINADVDTALNEDSGNYGVSESLQKNLAEPLNNYKNACTEFSALLSATAEDSRKVDPKAFFEAGQKARTAAYTLWQVAVKELDLLLINRAGVIRNDRLYTLLFVGVGLVFSVLVAFYFSRTITRPLASLNGTTQKILQGDYTARAAVLAKDDIGALAESFNAMVEGRVKAQANVEAENKRLQSNIQDLLVVVSDASDGKLGVRARVSEGALGNVADALNLMLENVGELIANAKTTSTQVASAASGITTVAQQLEAGEKRQSTEITATSQGVRELNSQAQRVLQNCVAATEAAENGRRTAEEGARAVREVIKGMEKIRENTQANAKKIKRLGDRSMEIAGIVKIISDISAKTDMLSLNASIEAARAGEQGRGFTVVAEQVRGLADRTRTLTNQIEKLVNDIQQETAEAVVQMETQTQEVEAGARAAEAAGGKLENIVTVSSASSGLVSEINQSATKQATRTQEMLLTVDSINRVVAESKIKVQETRTTSEQLANLSEELNKRLAQFEIEAIVA
jgi:methyl-accepting chemotaxis protein